MGTISQKIEIQGESSYKASLQNIVQKNKELAAEMKAVTSGAADEEKKMKVLTAQIENQQKYISTLNEKYNKQKSNIEETKKAIEEAAKKYGENSAEVQKLTTQLTKEETELSKTKTSINNATAELNKMEAQTKQTDKEVSNIGNDVEKSGGKFEGFGAVLKKAAEVGAAAMAAVGAAAVAATKKIWDMANQVAEMGDEIDKESQKLGLSTDSYQKLAYAMELSGSSISDLSKGVKNITDSLADAMNGVEGASDKFDALGVSLQNSDGSFKTNEQVLLDTIDALASMSDEVQRDAAAQDIFGKSAAELKPLLNAGSEGIRDMMQEAEDYGMVMSEDVIKSSAEFEDSLTRLKGATNGLKTRLVGDLLPAFGEIVDGFALMASGSEEGGEKLASGIRNALNQMSKMLPQLISVGGMILKGLIQGISNNLGGITETAVGLVTTLAQSLVENIPLIVSTISQALPTLVNSVVSLIGELMSHISEIAEPILSAIPLILEEILSALPSLIQTLAAELPRIVKLLSVAIPDIINAILSALPDIIVAICDALPQIVTSIIEALPSMAVNIAKAVILNFPKIVAAIGEGLWSILSQLGTWFGGLFSQLGTWLGEILTDVWDFIKKIPQKIAEGFSGIFEAGKNLVQGLWNGISDAASWVLEKIKGFGQSILDGIKGFFGIKSPSREMAWVGQMLDEGLANGISKYSGIAISEAMNVADDVGNAMSGIKTPTAYGRGGTLGAVTINVYGAEGQNINALADIVIDKLQRTIIGNEAVYA